MAAVWFVPSHSCLQGPFVSPSCSMKAYGGLVHPLALSGLQGPFVSSCCSMKASSGTTLGAAGSPGGLVYAVAFLCIVVQPEGEVRASHMTLHLVKAHDADGLTRGLMHAPIKKHIDRVDVDVGRHASCTTSGKLSSLAP